MKRERAAALALLLAWAVVLALLLSRHEMWRDELQAWLLARDSASPAELWSNTRYEGHPLLWHALLVPLTRVFDRPEAMQALHWTIAVAAAGVLLLAAPFPLWLRAALVFSYFPLYEYGVISRNYALTVLSVWLACVALARRSPFGLAGAGALAANSSPMGFLLAPALLSALALSPARLARKAAAAGLLGGAALLGLVQMLPPSDYEHARAWVLGVDPLRAAWVVRGFARALLPLVPARLHFWDASALFPVPPPPGWTAAVVAGAVITLACGLTGVALAVRRSPRALALWLVGTGCLIGFAYVKFPGAVRHQGFLFVLAVAALWIAVLDRAVRLRWVVALLAAPLATGLAASAIAAVVDARQPFSSARCAAREIEARGLARAPLVGGVDWAASGVAAYLPGARLYYPASGRDGSYVVWNLARTRQDDLRAADLARAAAALGPDAVLLVNARLPDDAGCVELFACPPAIVTDERLHGYRCPVR